MVRSIPLVPPVIYSSTPLNQDGADVTQQACDEYDSSNDGGGGGAGGECIQSEGCDLGCPANDQYEWYHWDGTRYIDMGEVCLDD